MKKHKFRISKISFLHYVKLIFRSALFVGALILYIICRVEKKTDFFQGSAEKPFIIGLVWMVFVVEMILRFFPSKLESMGCQKQFAGNYRPTGVEKPEKFSWTVTFAIAVSWIVLNAVIGVLYYAGVIDAGILLLIALAFSICDMICILFFCPFQTWFMKNKCCGSCRIYNWDYAMMFTPFVFIKSSYTWSLLGIALLLLIVWEYRLHRHPERFYESTNASLACKNCKEKLCLHKTQLRHFLKKNKIF